MCNNLDIGPGKIISLTIGQENNAKRLDIFLATEFPLYSRTFFKKLIEESAVMVNKKSITKSGYILKTDDIVEITFPPAPTLETSALPEKDLTIELLFEHPQFLIVYKPPYLMVHAPKHKSDKYTLVDWLIHKFKELKNIGYLDRPGIVHRLDKDTSGLIIIPRTNYAHTIFSNMFKDREIEKTYLAIVQGHPSSSGAIDYNITRHTSQRHKMTHCKNYGRQALTNYIVLEYFSNTSLVEVYPVTGRTHQIRVHFSCIGHPLVGDKVYGHSSKLIGRQALHAYRLSFIFENHRYTFWHSLPADMVSLIENLRTGVQV